MGSQLFSASKHQLCADGVNSDKLETTSMVDVEESDWLRLPLDEVTARARLTLSDAPSAESVFRGVEVLLSATVMQADAEESAIQQVAYFLRDISSTHPNVAHVVLTYLPTLPHPIPFVEIIPTLFAVSTPESIVDVVSQLSLMVADDKEVLIPVMAALAELPLPPSCVASLVAMAEEAVTVVDDDELPLLFKILIKSMDHVNTTSLCARLRCEISKLPLTSVALVIEVLWESLPLSHNAADYLLQHIDDISLRRSYSYGEITNNSLSNDSTNANPATTGMHDIVTIEINPYMTLRTFCIKITRSS